MMYGEWLGGKAVRLSVCPSIHTSVCSPAVSPSSPARYELLLHTKGSTLTYTKCDVSTITKFYGFYLSVNNSIISVVHCGTALKEKHKK